MDNIDASSTTPAGAYHEQPVPHKRLSEQIDERVNSLSGHPDTMCASDSYALRIIDESVTRQGEVPSVEAVSDPHFRSFIATVAGHVVSEFGRAMPCPENLDEPMIELVFVRLPLVTSGDEPIAPALSLNEPRSEVACRIESPWVEVAIRRSPTPQIGAVFIWNERQFLLDQVLLSGESPSLRGPLMPLTNRSFQEFAEDYAKSEIPRPPEERSHTIAERIPADVLWLFRHSWQSTRGPFSGIARSAMRSTLERAAAGYTDLVLTLFDQCIEPGTSEQRYESILDVRDVLPLDEYRIHRLN